jgi:ribosome recycling factor
MSEDLVRDAEEQVQELTNQFTKKFDSIFATKEAEIMTV